MFSSSRNRDLFILLVLCIALFWWRLGKLGLIDPDEPFYAQTAREMLVSGDWVTPQIFGQPQFEKPIFFYWLTAASYRVFGVNEFAGRIPSALPATAMVLLVYAFGARVFNRRTGLLAATVLASGIEYTLMSRLMLTDIALALFIAGSLCSYWLAIEDEERRGRWIVLHFVCAGFAVLTKGPVATLVTLFATACFSFWAKRPMPYRSRALPWGLALYALIAVPWFATMLWKFGWTYFNDFFVHENIMRLLHAEHPANNHFYYYVAILLGGSIPWLPVLACAIWRAWRGVRHDARLVFLWSWILTSLVFLTIAQSKLPSYIFYVFVPLALVAAATLEDFFEKGFRTRGERKLVFGLAILQVVIGIAAPMVKQAKPFATPTLLFAVCLALGVALLASGRMRGWVTMNALATIALIGGALEFSTDRVEAFSSARPTAEAMQRGDSGGRSYLAGKFLARGIYFYADKPVTVLANKAQPFWSPHPLPVVAGGKELATFLTQHPDTVCTIRRSEWPNWAKLDVVKAAGEPEWIGDNAVVRFGPR